MSQICTKCHVEQPFLNFHKNAQRANGHSTWCKSCVKQRHELKRSHDLAVGRRYYRNHKATMLAQNTAWRKAHPDYHREHQRKNREAYARNRQKYVSTHRDVLRQRARLYAKAHLEARRLREAERRARIRNAPVSDLTPAQWEEIKQHYKYRCVYCGKKPRSLEMDHITPLSRGGSHTKTNIVPACRPCNIKKGPRKNPKPTQPLLL